MCYAKPGIRCSAFTNQKRTALAQELNETEEAQEALRQQILDVMEAGGATARLKRKLQANIDKVAALKVANENAVKEWLKTPAGIAHLREQASDTSLSPEKRELHKRKADRLEAEAAKARDAVRVSREREETLRNDLAAAGVPAKTIQQVMELKPESTFGSSIVSSSTAYKNWKQAEKRFKAITQEARAAEAAAQKNGKPAELAAVIQKYSALRAEAQERVDMNTAAYYTTPAGIQELHDTAAAASKRSEREYYRHLAESYQRLRDSRLEGNNLRRRRESAIREAMISVGKDPEAAIKAYRKSRKVVPGKAGRKPNTGKFVASTNKSTTLTGPDMEKLDREATATGVSINALIRMRALDTPTTHMNGNVREVLANAPVKPKMTGHRNTTVLGERRNRTIGFSLTAQEASIIHLRAQSLNMTDSSYIRDTALGLDVRQIQTDRSDFVNGIKAANMMDKHATPEQSAKNLAA